MKLLYVSFVRLPTEKAHGVQIMKTCEALANQGVEVELMTPNRKTHIKEEPFEYYGVERNFTITTLSIPDFVRFGVVGFLFSMLWFSEVVKWKKVFFKSDIIYSRDAFVLLQYLFLRKKLIYEAHTKPTIISRFVVRRVHKVVVISRGLRDEYIRLGVPSGKIILAPDAVDLQTFKFQYSKEEERRHLNIPVEKKVALYVGKISSAKGADTFARASEYLPDEWIAALIGPDNFFKNELKASYPKALFLPETPYKDLPKVLATADILILPNSKMDVDASNYTSPLKAFAYIASGKPILASKVPALIEIFQDSASFFEPNSAESLAEEVKKLPLHSLSRDVYTWRKRAEDILRYL